MKSFIISIPFLTIMAVFWMIVLFLLQFTKLPPEVPVFYSTASPSDQVADLWFILIIPLTLIIIMFINNYVSWKYVKGDSYINKIFYITNVTIIFLMTFIFTRIIILIS